MLTKPLLCKKIDTESLNTNAIAATNKDLGHDSCDFSVTAYSSSRYSW